MFSAAIKSGAAASTPVDAQFNYVTMLLHGDGTNGAQNNTFLDSSTNNFTITRNGNTTQGSFSPYGSNWSTNFVPAAGLGDQLTVGNATNLQFGTGDFTFEAWVNTNGYGNYQTLYDKGYGASGSFLIQMSTDYKPFVYSSGGFLMTSSTAFVVGTWNHFAVVRSGSTMTMYINGTSVASVSNSTNFNDASNIAVGARYADRTYPWSGYVSNMRLVKGTAVYTSAFTPPTSPLTAISGTSLLISQSNRFIDNSANNYTVAPVGVPSVQRFNPFGTSTAYSTATIGGSGYFLESSSSYIQTTSSATIGSGNFTVEGWFYRASTSRIILASIGDENTSTGGTFYIDGSTGYYNLVTNGSVVVIATSPPANTVNCWTHFAFVRSGSTVTCYINGVSGGTNSNSSSFSGLVTLGAEIYNGTTYAGTTGYVSNVRITTTAVYTSAFTPPTAPVTAISGTQFLANFINGAIYDNAMMNDLETVGNAQISTSVKKYGTGSMAFDGSGDRLTASTSPNYAMGTGDYTIEFWCYPSNTGYGCFIDTRSANPSTTGISIFNNGTSLEIYANGLILSSSGAFTLNTWQHFALSRSGTSLKSFVNGTQVGSTATNSDNLSAGRMVIGDNVENSYPLNGYIDDLRITKGYARYTSTFTPPTAAFPNIGPT